MKLLAISDLHVGHRPNREALAGMPSCPDDWLIIAGDIGENAEHLRLCLDALLPRFSKLIWVPGNHELYTSRRDPCQLRGEDRYRWLVGLCQERGVLTPEDDWPLWPGEGPPTRLAPVFVGYDYSFGPAGLSPQQVVSWASEAGIRPTDERLLHPDPYPSRSAWCEARVALTEARLSAVAPGERLVLINHYPLRADLVRLFRIPRFTPWCGTRLTEEWHRRFPIDVVVSGHLHMRATDWRDGVRFEEVALGYPRHWRSEQGIGHYLRQILPRTASPPGGRGGPIWHR
ncbi:MAG: 3',5'-cyclic AMP phosphodiesterase CpdA [Myxococcota bacterium]|jgi:3',5'-cyclic AMP phosphodiesterase CpdA